MTQGQLGWLLFAALALTFPLPFVAIVPHGSDTVVMFLPFAALVLLGLAGLAFGAAAVAAHDVLLPVLVFVLWIVIAVYAVVVSFPPS